MGHDKVPFGFDARALILLDIVHIAYSLNNMFIVKILKLNYLPEVSLKLCCFQLGLLP